MLLRRLTEHVKNENWFAVFVDFLIVVMGVFLGIQIGNWNDARNNQQNYDQAIERFRAEIATNLRTLDDIERSAIAYLKRGSSAFDVLLSCEDSPENRQVISEGLTALSVTYGLNLRNSALKELNNAPALLAEQTPAERDRFSDLQFYFDLTQYEAGFVETLPLQERMENNPIIGIGESVQRNLSYVGADYSRRQRLLQLNVPVDEACRNDQLIKSFYYWERWQSVLPVLVRNMQSEYELTLEMLDG